jgi:hypothetical protein
MVKFLLTGLEKPPLFAHDAVASKMGDPPHIRATAGFAIMHRRFGPQINTKGSRALLQGGDSITILLIPR